MQKKHDDTVARQNGPDDKSSNCHVYIESGVQVDIPQSLKDEIRTANNESAAHNRKQLILSVIGATAAIAAAFLVAWQALLLRQSNVISRSSLESVQRAFITHSGVRGGRVLMHTEKGDIVRYEVVATLENSGATPAVNVLRYMTFADLAKEPTDEEFISKKAVPPSTPVTVVGPKQRLEIGPLSIPEEVMTGDLSRHGNDKYTYATTFDHGLFIWGWVLYRDVFPSTSQHLTEFCLEKTGVAMTSSSPAKPTDMTTFSFNPCQHHNCTDQDCPNYREVIGLVSRHN